MFAFFALLPVICKLIDLQSTTTERLVGSLEPSKFAG